MISRFPRTLWILFWSLLFMANTCLQAIFKQFAGTVNRRWCDQALQSWVKRMIKLLDIRYRVINPHHVAPQEGQPTIIMCNHSSLLDIPLSLLAFPQISLRMLAKKELGNIPLFGSAMRAAEFPLIDRHNRRQAIEDLKVLDTLLKQGIVVWIAPEGTRSKDGRLAPFKKGGFITALQTGATIIPIGIRGAHRVLPARSLEFCPGQEVDIRIGAPIQASQYRLDNKEELISAVFDSMTHLLEGEDDALGDKA